MHFELTATLSHGTKVGCIAEHFGLRNFGGDDLFAVCHIRAENASATFVHVAEDIAEILVGDDDFCFYDRFEETRACRRNAVCIGEFCRSDECDFLAVDGVIFSVVKRSFKVDERISRKNAVFDCFALNLFRLRE